MISGHVKNLALLNCNIDNEQYFVAGNIFYQSTIENVYVQGTTNSTYGIARLSDEGAKIINGLANITFTDTAGTAYGDGTTKNYSELVNCYAITNAKTAPDGTKGLTEPYASVYRFIQANPTFGEGCPITFDSNGVYFNGKMVADYQTAQYTVQHKWGDTVLATDAFEGVVGEKTTATSRSDLGYVCIDTVIDNQEILSDGSTVVVINYADYPELLQFNAEASLKLVKSGSNVSLVDDTDSEGNAIKAVCATAIRGASPTPFTINLGGKYKVSEIAGIQVSYKITDGYDKTYVGIYANEIMSDYSGDRISTIIYDQSVTGYKTQNITQSNLLGKLGADDYVSTLSFTPKDNNRAITIRVDSIKIIPFSVELLQFNSEESIALVTSGSNVSIVDDTQAADGKAVKGTALRTGTATAFTINLGGQYKVSEIVSVKVTYRVVSGQSGWLMGFFFNEYSSYNDYAGKHNTGPSSEYSTVTITRETIVANKVNEDEYLNSISLIGKTANQDFTVCIDSIEIVLK